MYCHTRAGTVGFHGLPASAGIPVVKPGTELRSKSPIAGWRAGIEAVGGSTEECMHETPVTPPARRAAANRALRGLVMQAFSGRGGTIRKFLTGFHLVRSAAISPKAGGLYRRTKNVSTARFTAGILWRRGHP